jgi:zinc transporter, ZIP family
MPQNQEGAWMTTETVLTTESVLIAFGLTLFAGLATGVGGAIAIFARETNTRLLSVSLGFAAGVMIYVSFVEILSKANESLAAEMGEAWAARATVLAFFAGMAVVALIDKLVPSIENPHEMHRVEEIEDFEEADKRGGRHRNLDKHRLQRMGVLTALAVAIHNFPEGLATFVAAIEDPALGLTIAIAIAIHNVPEGVAVAVPIFYATGSRVKAFLYSLASGLAEPLGAAVGFLLLWQFFGPVTFGVVFASVAGIMVFISMDQLLPAAREYGEHHHAVYGLVAGMALMAVSLLLFI